MEHDYFVKCNGFILRPLRKSDLELLRKWRNSDNIRIWFLNQGIIDTNQQMKWFEKYVRKHNDLMFIIEETEELMRPVGAVALYNIDDHLLEAEFGRLMIGDSEARGKYLGLKVTKALCDFGFNTLKLKKIYLEVYEDNKPAIKIYKKCGFQYEREYIKNRRKIIVMQKMAERVMENEKED
ncbi:GNAT family N-acetyltransferase [Caloranaerobacter azorensis]|uniref:Acetyltransferase (GNAT) domain-containing protein n=2 Tax=Caloranaerobacter azorensis TaxID=116090 RepID=A0A1M5SZY9_9FIRM|nr:GNAT family N-acetyltransferase [Caloranaerobacter azorensis]QIB27585.1 GNAT family N-acetyltransferase [Caloranaerobacter azorensis]SHH43940.1 Acetyltransferase (GNAT) domain-containing protein [Caloranaerobacter azorensis DSM 13643]